MFSRRLCLLKAVLPLHVEPQDGQRPNVGKPDDGGGPAHAVEHGIGDRVEDRRGEELQRVGGDVEGDVNVPGRPEQEREFQWVAAMLNGKLVFKARAVETGEQPPREQQAEGDHDGAVAEPVDVPSDGGKVRGQGVLVHARALEAVGEGIDEGGDEGEQVGKDAHRSGDLPVDVFAGDEDAPEPVGEDVHGQPVLAPPLEAVLLRRHTVPRVPIDFI